MSEHNAEIDASRYLDDLLVALWQCETERGFEHMSAKVHALVASLRCECCQGVRACGVKRVTPPGEQRETSA